MVKKCIRFLTITGFFLPLVLTSYGNVSMAHHSSWETESVQKVDHLLSLCLTSTNRLVTLIGIVSQKLSQIIHKSEYTAVTRMSIDVPPVDVLYTIAKHTLTMYNDELYFRFDHKAQGFVLAASSQPILRRQIIELKRSRWWNADGLFIIIDDGSAITNSCKNAHGFLWLAWHYNMLSSVFLCHDKRNILMLYSYNPYNGMAPKNWLKVGRYSGRRGHPWILFKRNASDTPKDCSEVFFDKTKTLDDYKIRTNAKLLKPRLTIDYNKSGLARYGGDEGKMMNCIFRFLNASIEEVPYTGSVGFGYVDKNGTVLGMIGEVASGRVDIGLNGRYMVGLWGLGSTYPHGQTDFCFVTKSRGNVPQWMNLAFGFDVWVSFGLITVILFASGVLSYYSSVSDGFLNGLRLLISTGLLKLPSKLPARFFLASLFLFCLIANGSFQGQLISLLTKPRAYHNPETQVELGQAGQAIEGYPPFAEYIEDPVLRSHFSVNYSFTYDNQRLRTEHLAYVIDCQLIPTDFANFSNLHIVSQRLRIFHMIFIAALDWPLMDRFNRLVQRLVESGLLAHWKTQDLDSTIDHGTRFHSPSLSLPDLAFIFEWLIFGLIFSTLVFLYEVLGAWYRNNFRNRPSH